MTEVSVGSDGAYMSGTGSGLLAFLKRLGERGEINLATADNLRRASSKVLEREGDLDGIDVRELDVEDVLSRFETLNRLNYNDKSLQTYRSRFRQSVAMYVSFLAGEPAWKNAAREGSPILVRKKATKKAGGGTRRRTPVGPNSEETEPTVPLAVQLGRMGNSGNFDPGTRLVAYDLPLRPSLIVRLTLPVDLTPGDADRVAAFVRSLAFEPATSEVDNTSERGR